MSIKQFIRDVYEGIYLRDPSPLKASDRYTVNTSFHIALYSYHLSFCVLLAGLRVLLWGPFVMNAFEVILLLFGIYFLIFHIFIQQYKTFEVLEESMEEVVKEAKMKRSLRFQKVGTFLFIASFLLVALLFEIFEPSKNGGLF
jgi:dolichol kinase